jgi:hypothetical protein
MKKNLVMSIATNYRFYQLEPFVRSLRNTGFDGDIIIFCDNLNEDTVNKLLEYKVILKRFDQKKYEKKRIHIMNYRFKFYYDLLLKNHNKYENVLIADVRDIVFQKDPFDYSGYAPINYFFEANKIKDCKINSYVFGKVSSPNEFKKYSKNNISCAGTTIGNTKEILNYLKIMSNKLKEEQLPIDQGYHNYIFHSRKIKNSKGFYNLKGPVLTLASMKEVKFNKNGDLINRDGSIVNIVHQYDRNLRLLYKFNTLTSFTLSFSKLTIIKIKRRIKITLFNLPFWGKYFRKRYHDPTRFA